jgi:hypothetical protein
VLSGGVGLASFILIGLGAANIVPILFRLAGPQQAMPKGLAALTTDGYSGMLAGPAAIGFLSKGSGLHNVLVFGRAIVCPPLLLSKYVTSEAST